jgi:hypothetical protein
VHCVGHKYFLYFSKEFLKYDITYGEAGLLQQW